MSEINGISVYSLLALFPPVWLFNYFAGRLLYARFAPEREKRSQVIGSALLGVVMYTIAIVILIAGPSPDDPAIGGRHELRVDRGVHEVSS